MNSQWNLTLHCICSWATCIDPNTNWYSATPFLIMHTAWSDIWALTHLSMSVILVLLTPHPPSLLLLLQSPSFYVPACVSLHFLWVRFVWILFIDILYSFDIYISIHVGVDVLIVCNFSRTGWRGTRLRCLRWPGHCPKAGPGSCWSSPGQRCPESVRPTP